MTKAPSVSIVDYGCGNLLSVSRAMAHCGASVELCQTAEQVMASERIILPGVGAFGSACEALQRQGLIDSLREFAASGRPLLGICLGMQLLFEESLEFGTHEGLGLIPGRVVPIDREIPGGGRRKIPNIGWAAITCPSDRDWSSCILADTPERTSFYFVHSFVGQPVNSRHVLAFTEYEGAEFCAAVRNGNVTGVQFHPEKSGPAGLAVLNRFLASS